MAKEPEQVKKDPGQNVLLYKAWLRNNWERLTKAFGQPLAVVLVTLAAVFVLAFVLLLEVGAIGLAAGLIWYLSPVFSADDKLSIVERKDLVQGFASAAQAAAVGLAGAVGFIGLLFTGLSLRQTRRATQRTLKLTEQGQITERFTRAIDQLGATDDDRKPRLEVRLGGIYALERIDKESPERAYHSTVMEVLTAYVRENAHWPPRSPEPPEENFIAPPGDDALSDSTSNEAAEQDKAAEQGAAPALRTTLTDIQAIMDILKRREEDDVPEEHRVESLDLRGADLRGTNLLETNLQKANLYGAHLEKVILADAHLEGAVLVKAHLEGAVLRNVHLDPPGGSVPH